MSSLSKNLPTTMEKPDDLTLEECQEAFAMFRIQRKVQQCIDLIIKSQGLWHIRDQIFGPLNHETLENCRKVSESWNESLQRMALVKYLEEFGESLRIMALLRNFEREDVNGEEVSAIIRIPEWNKAVKDYGAKSSIEDLQEIKDSLDMINGKDLEYPIHQAAGHGALKLMEFILTTSFDMNSIDQHGKNIFQVACQNGKIEIVNLLIESTKHDIDLNARDYDGATALLLACKYGETETAKFRIGLSTINGGINDFNAYSFGRIGKIKLMIELSIKYARHNDGRTPFLETCSNGHPETVKLMIESSTKYDIDVNARDNNGDTALHLARTKNVEIIMKHWEKIGIDIKTENNMGQTALDVVNQMIYTHERFENETWKTMLEETRIELDKVKTMLQEAYFKIVEKEMLHICGQN